MVTLYVLPDSGDQATGAPISENKEYACRTSKAGCALRGAFLRRKVLHLSHIYSTQNMITRVKPPKKQKQNGAPKLLASIPKKEGERREEFVHRFLEKLADLPNSPS